MKAGIYTQNKREFLSVSACACTTLVNEIAAIDTIHNNNVYELRKKRTKNSLNKREICERLCVFVSFLHSKNTKSQVTFYGGENAPWKKKSNLIANRTP